MSCYPLLAVRLSTGDEGAWCLAGCDCSFALKQTAAQQHHRSLEIWCVLGVTLYMLNGTGLVGWHLLPWEMCVRLFQDVRTARCPACPSVSDGCS